MCFFRLFIYLISLGLAVGCTGVGSSFQAAKKIEAFCKPKTSLTSKKSLALSSPFQAGKVHLSASSIENSNGMDSAMALGMPDATREISAERKIIALVDNECTQNSLRSAPISRGLALSQQFNSKLRTQAYSTNLGRSFSLGEFEKLVNVDECLLGVSDEAEVVSQQIPNDPRFLQQRHLAAIDAPSAYDLFYDLESGIQQDVVIAIVDTGVDLDHQDLAANIWKDAQGKSGYDFVNSDDDPDDDNGHGTHVAGLAAAVGQNGIGVTGVMYKHGKIMAVKVLNASASGTLSVVANGVRYAVDNGADVINLSLGGGVGENAAIRDALAYALENDVAVILAAGNSNDELTGSHFLAPASYGRRYSGAITVGSVDSVTLEKSGFSNYGNEYVELMAPGSNGIMSTFLNNAYIEKQGTSMSAPITAGAIGLAIGMMRSQAKPYSPALLEQLLTLSAAEMNSLKNYAQNGRLLNLFNLATLTQTAIETQALILKHPQSQVGVLGGEVTLEVIPEVQDGLIFQWRKDGINLPGTNGSSLVIPDLGPDDAGSYSVLVSNGTDEALSDEAQVSLASEICE